MEDSKNSEESMDDSYVLIPVSVEQFERLKTALKTIDTHDSLSRVEYRRNMWIQIAALVIIVGILIAELYIAAPVFVIAYLSFLVGISFTTTLLAVLRYFRIKNPA